MFSVQFTNLTKRGNEPRRALEILKKIWIYRTYLGVIISSISRLTSHKVCSKICDTQNNLDASL